MKRLPKRQSKAMDTYELTDSAKDSLDMTGLFSGAEYMIDPRNRLIYDPQDAHRIPKTGAWVMIVRQLPAIVGSIDQEVRVGRVFWVEHEEGTDEAGFRKDGAYKVILHSPWGDVCLWPYEYARLDTAYIIDCWSKSELTFHPLNMEPGRLNEVTFYARSRGISLADALVMALGSVTGNIGWFEPTPEIAAACEDLATSVNLTLSGRRATRRRKPSPMLLTVDMDGEGFEVELPARTS